MGRRQKNSRLSKLPQFIASVFILTLFLFPAFGTLRWFDGVIFGNDPRATLDLDNFVVREADKNDPKIKPFNEPLITVTFDDGWESVYSNGMPIMQKYGIQTTQYILGDEFDNILYLSEAQVRDMQRYGHEIASHSLSHPNLTKLNDEDLFKEVFESKQKLENKFSTSIKDFASPLGAQNEHTISTIKQYYRSQRNTEADPKVVGIEDINVSSNFNRYNIIAYTVRKSTTIADIAALVDFAKANNGWVILTYHQIDELESEYSVGSDNFEQHMEYLFNNNIRSATMSEVLGEIETTGVAKW